MVSIDVQTENLGPNDYADGRGDQSSFHEVLEQEHEAASSHLRIWCLSMEERDSCLQPYLP